MNVSSPRANLKALNQSIYRRAQVAIAQCFATFTCASRGSLSADVHVGIELSLRKSFTDYLDDVSTTYVDQNLLLANRGQQAVDLAYRGDEVNAGPYPVAGTVRGTLDVKDWYYFTGLTVSFRLGNGGGGVNGGRGFGRKSKVGCPAIAY